CLGGAAVLQALRRLDLGRGLPHGPRRPAGDHRPPLPPGAQVCCRNLRRDGGCLTMARYLVPLGVFLLLAVFLAVGLFRDPREVPSPLIDKPAPVFSLPQLHEPDRALTPTDMQGKVWLFNVWASWCVACLDEHPV